MELNDLCYMSEPNGDGFYVTANIDGHELEWRVGCYYTIKVWPENEFEAEDIGGVEGYTNALKELIDYYENGISNGDFKTVKWIRHFDDAFPVPLVTLPELLSLDGSFHSGAIDLNLHFEEEAEGREPVECAWLIELTSFLVNFTCDGYKEYYELDYDSIEGVYQCINSDIAEKLETRFDEDLDDDQP